MPLLCMMAMSRMNRPIVANEQVGFEKLPFEVQDFQEIYESF